MRGAPKVAERTFSPLRQMAALLILDVKKNPLRAESSYSDPVLFIIRLSRSLPMIPAGLGKRSVDLKTI